MWRKNVMMPREKEVTMLERAIMEGRYNCITPRYPKGKGGEGERWREVFDGMRKCVFLDSLKDCKREYIDLSENWDGRVRAWHEGDCVYIGAEGGINASVACKRLFYKTGLEEIDFNGCFHTDEAESMESMFENCRVKKLDLSGFVTDKVRVMESMFQDCHYLKEVDVSGFDMFSVHNVTAMFASCSSLEKIDVSKWDMRNIKVADYMFFWCSELKKLDMSKWNIQNVDNLASMFFCCDELREINLTGFVTDEITDMYEMLTGLRDDVRIIKTDACILKEDCGLKETARVISTPRREKKKTVVKKARYTKNVMKKRFDHLSLNEAIDYCGKNGVSTSFFTESGQINESLFKLFEGEEYECWKGLFDGIKECRFLKHLFFCPFDARDVSQKGDGSVRAWRKGDRLYIGAWGGVTSGRESCERLFENCKSLKEIYFNSAFNTKDALSMFAMFKGCESLVVAQLDGIETEKVTNATGMFEDCTSIKKLDLSQLVIGADAFKDDMFANCERLGELDIRNMSIEEDDWIFMNMPDVMLVTVKEGVTRKKLRDLPYTAKLFKAKGAEPDMPFSC